MKEKHSLEYRVEFDPDTMDAETRMEIHCTTGEAILLLSDALVKVCKEAGLETSGQWTEVLKIFSSFYVQGMMNSILSDGESS